MQKEILELHNLIKLKNIDKAYVETRKLYKFHNKNKDIIINDLNYKWQKNKKANLTGTFESYHPANHSEKEKMYSNEKNKNSVWKPD